MSDVGTPATGPESIETTDPEGAGTTASGTTDPESTETTASGTTDPEGAGTTASGTTDPGSAGTTASGTTDPGSAGTTAPAQRAGEGSTATAVADRPALLQVTDLGLRFGGVVALDGVSFDIREGEILGLIGPNGAGKTTCFNAITGVFRPTAGDIRFRGESLVGKKKFAITKAGIARTFQNVRLFPEMTALENVQVGADAHHKTSVISALFRLPRHWREERDGRDKAYELLEFVGIRQRAGELARNLSYGEQRRLEIARALATRPTLICLDEPAAGFNPAEKEELLRLIRRIRDTGVTVLLIEHDMRLVMGVTDRIVVLEFGKKIAEGLPAEVREDPKVIAAYLGVPDDAA